MSRNSIWGYASISKPEYENISRGQKSSLIRKYLNDMIIPVGEEKIVF